MAKKALLMILDGWGIGKHGKGDVIFNTPTPYLDLLTATSAHGRGCLAGSVYAAAVILPDDYQNELFNDSKQLTEKRRYELREIIERDA